MKKIFVILAVFATLIFVVSCGGGSKKVDTNDIPDTGDTVTDEDTADTDPSDSGHENSDTAQEQPDNGDSQPDNGDSQPDNGDTDTAAEMQEGIYLGIIGFNYKLYVKDISFLTGSNMSDFHYFIDNELPWDIGTALYYADYEALEMMQNYTPIPPMLQTVALVTFTDGDDISSDGENNPENYETKDEYLNAIHDKIMEGIHGLPLEAYSIGLKSNDTGKDFIDKLKKLASKDDNAFELSDIDEVNDRFRIIAENLYYLFKTVDIEVKVAGGYDDLTRIRFTFDIECDSIKNECEKNGQESSMYIDATYRKNNNERSFEDIVYQGFSGNQTTVQCGSKDEKGFYPCSFKGLQYDMNTKIKQIEMWKYGDDEWMHQNESLKKEDSSVKESKNSALIMLVLDCTTSLGIDHFEKLKQMAKDFITTLVNGVSKGTCGDRTIDNSEVCDSNAIECSTLDASFTGGYATCQADCKGYDTTDCKSDNGGNGGDGGSSTPCELNPCNNIVNSTGICSVTGSSYICGCKSGYTWNGGSCQSNGGSSLPECSKTSGTPCYDSSSHLTWSKISSSTMTWSAATTFCQGSEMNGYGGFTDWRLPNIDELKTLIINPSGTPRTKNCAVSEATGHLASSDWTCSTCTEACTQSTSGTVCSSCNGSSEGIYSKLGDGEVWLWSSSLRSDHSDGAWHVYFSNGVVSYYSIDPNYNVRCVR